MLALIVFILLVVIILPALIVIPHSFTSLIYFTYPIPDFVS